MRKIASLLAVLLLFCGVALAQTRTVKGIVRDPNGSPVPFATITEAGTSNATKADADGSFTISVPTNARLTISASGFTTQTVSAGDAATVTLAVNQQQLQEVVVTALGITRAERSLGYTTSQLKSAEITKARETNVVNSLAGKVSGVRITSQSGTLGGSSKIIIRGQSSFADAAGGQPIFVIDGLPVDNQSQQLATAPSAVPQGTAGVDFGNRAGDINADDVESITVLKGAAATALYGARAKNGAIIITTKKGKRGSNVVRFNSSVRFDTPLRLPDYQNEYAQGQYGAYAVNSTNGWGPKISAVQDLKFPNFLNQQVTLQAYPDNVKDFYKVGHTYINSLAFEGGGESGDFRLGYTNTYQDGIVEKESLMRNNLSLNAGRTISQKINVRTSINYVNTVGKNRPIQSSNNSSSLTQIVNFMPRTVDVDALKANYIDSTGAQINLVPNKTGNNPYWVIYNNTSENRVDRVYGNVVLSYKPFNWLTISDNIGADFYNEFRKLVVRPGTAGALQGNFFQANIFSRILNNDFMATAEKQIN
ncbi:MAG: TonB-dependent receptor plug domain-containing protein, partial [Flavisolibacter sp.]|nr:TonB-dependent receptor plug domain-containing protein [Flavisolibacter sp.]